MSALPFRPYGPGSAPAQESVPVTAIVLAKNEAVNIGRCVQSLRWCRQVLVVDSGSTDDTVALASAAGAEVIHQAWLGYAAQREFTLRHRSVRHDWIYFVDADEWVSPALAAEVAAAVAQDRCAAFGQRFRLVFLGRWISHCGWYQGSWIVRLGRRDALSYDVSAQLGERASVAGPVGRLSHDLVDEDLKGLAAWLHKHVSYAEAESLRRATSAAVMADRLRAARASTTHRHWTRLYAKEVVYPAIPAKPAALFCYLYLFRAGWRDGRQGLVFCLLRAWHELVIQELSRTPPSGRRPAAPPPIGADE